MDQIKVGKFISECRKNKNMTQAELAEKLNITDRAISRWETGKGIPDASLMLALCNELDISVNELLSGEKVENDKYINNAEENLLLLTKQIEKRKKILKNIQKLLLLFSIILFISNMVFNSLYGDNWDRSNILFISYCLMSVNFGIAVIVSFLNFDKR